MKESLPCASTTNPFPSTLQRLLEVGRRNGVAARGQIPCVAIDMHEPSSIEEYYYEPLHLFSNIISQQYNTVGDCL